MNSFQQRWMDISMLTQAHTVIYYYHILLLVITTINSVNIHNNRTASISIFIHKGISVCHISHRKQTFLNQSLSKCWARDVILVASQPCHTLQV